MSEAKKTPPSTNEIELTLLGSGYGESIIIHIGNNQWVVIDSCIDVDKNSCVPLEYLQLIGVSPLNVILIVASHWHDDHVKGLSILFEACLNAKFCCSSALNSDEFLTFVARFETGCTIKLGSGVSEFYTILEIIRKRKSSPPPVLAASNRRVLYKSPEDLSHLFLCEIWSLSPSDREIQKFWNKIKNLIPIKDDPQHRVSSARNNLSVVIQIVIGEEIMLLGSDLEETKDSFTGWSVIVDSAEKPKGKAKIFKIPHHGSDTAHSSDVWTQLIEEKSFAILTPFDRGRKKLPAPDDVERIQTYTNHAYSTVPLKSSKPIKRPSLVEKEITKKVGKLRPIASKVGMIRLRKNINLPNAEWHLELFDGACHLSKMN